MAKKQPIRVPNSGPRRNRQNSPATLGWCYSSHVGSEYDADELEFIKAVDAWRKANKVKFPAASDFLAIARSLGYRKVGQGEGAKES